MLDACGEGCREPKLACMWPVWRECGPAGTLLTVRHKGWIGQLRKRPAGAASARFGGKGRGRSAFSLRLTHNMVLPVAKGFELIHDFVYKRVRNESAVPRLIGCITTRTGD